MPEASPLTDDDVALHEARQRSARLAAQGSPTTAVEVERTVFAHPVAAEATLVRPGCNVFTDPERRRDENDRPFGGVLVAVDHTDNLTTGEVRRDYRVWNTWLPAADAKPNTWPRRQGCWLTVHDTELGPDSFQAMQSATVILATCQMAAEYARRRGESGKRLLVSADHDLIHGQQVLAQALSGGHHG